MALYGVESQQAALDAKAAAARSRENEQRRIKYAEDEQVRRDEAEKHKERLKRNRLKRIAEGKGSVDYARYLEGLMSEDERERYETARAKGRGFRQIARKYDIGGQRVTAKGILRAVKSLLKQAKRLERDLESLTPRPWKQAGYACRQAWLNAGSEDALEHERTRWRLKKHKRRATEKGAGGDGVSHDRWYECMKAWDYRCAYCGLHRSYARANGHDLEVDHVVPMPIGPNDDTNIAPACKRCNTSKSDSDLLVWAASQGHFLTGRIMSIYNAVHAAKGEMSDA